MREIDIKKPAQQKAKKRDLENKELDTPSRNISAKGVKKNR
jgi:hypothetical protein